jgi:hypothetical protein
MLQNIVYEQIMLHMVLKNFAIDNPKVQFSSMFALQSNFLRKLSL